MRIEPGAEEQPMTVDELTELDRRAVVELGLPSVVLMEHAGRGAACEIHEWLGRRGVPLTGTVVILAGPGNNGGDGFVVARWLVLFRRTVRVLLCGARERLRGDAALEFSIADAAGIELLIEPGLEDVRAELASAGAAVDALLGTGGRGAPRGMVAAWIEALNAASTKGLHVAALDLPSGLSAAPGPGKDACGGQAAFSAFGSRNELPSAPSSAGTGASVVRAHLTVTFAAPKAVLLEEPGRSVSGEVVVVPIGVGRRILPPG